MKVSVPTTQKQERDRLDLNRSRSFPLATSLTEKVRAAENGGLLIDPARLPLASSGLLPATLPVGPSTVSGYPFPPN